VLIRGRTLYAANVGDSRALLISEDQKVLQLTIDQLPDDPVEMRRIQKAGGRVQPILNQINGKFTGPNRMFLATEDIPGLVVSRTIGDYKAHQAGIISQPEIFEINVHPEDQTLVIGSEAVFQYLSNEDIAKIVEEFYEANSAEKAANSIVARAT